MAAIDDVNCRGIAPREEYELIDTTGITSRFGEALARVRPGVCAMLILPIYYFFVAGIADNRVINDPLWQLQHCTGKNPHPTSPNFTPA